MPPLNLFMKRRIVGLEEWHVMNIAPQGLHFLYLRDAAAGIHAETTEQSGQRVSLSEMGGEEWPSGENTITSVCVPRCRPQCGHRFRSTKWNQ